MSFRCQSSVLAKITNVNENPPLSESDWGGLLIDVCWRCQQKDIDNQCAFADSQQRTLINVLLLTTPLIKNLERGSHA